MYNTILSYFHIQHYNTTTLKHEYLKGIFINISTFSRMKLKMKCHAICPYYKKCQHVTTDQGFKN